MASAPVMEFEKPIAELEKQIDELKRLADGQRLDVSDEITPLERKLSTLRDEIYKNLSPLQRVQVARNNKRPFTLDYIRLVFTDWIELHGDRAFREAVLRCSMATFPIDLGREPCDKCDTNSALRL